MNFANFSFESQQKSNWSECCLLVYYKIGRAAYCDFTIMSGGRTSVCCMRGFFGVKFCVFLPDIVVMFAVINGIIHLDFILL